MHYPYGPEARILEVRGDRSPLMFCHLHGQHTHTPTVFGLNDAQDVALFGTKTEMHGRFFDVVNSRRVRGLSCRATVARC